MADDRRDPNDPMLGTAHRWLAVEPDPDIAIELADLIERAEAGDAAELAGRFAGRLQFGTAGLRAAVGAGSMRMNRLVVRQAAAGVGEWLLDGQETGTIPDAAKRGVVIAYDARRKSDLFALDTARVLAAMGIRSMLHPGVQPTPVLSWSITGIDAAAGVVVTASHNPPADNGYKVFLATGSQIVDPVDRQISECIDRFDPLAISLAAEDDPHITYLDTSWVDAYVDAIPAVRLRPDVAGGVVAYTALHGVGGAVLERAFAAAGFDPPVVVAEQHQPDGTFPTVSFPNPEEPGAMDLLLDVARGAGAHVALANDPDADRLGVAIPQADGTWRRLTGDEIGWLFADHILANTSGDDRLVITTIVSSSLLARMAEAAGVHSEETFTGFKWIGKIVTERPGLRFVFGYEQALGYLVTDRPLDKDGIERGGPDGGDHRPGDRRGGHVAGPARRDCRSLRSVRHGRPVGAARSGTGRRMGALDRGEPAGRSRWPGGDVGVVVPAGRPRAARRGGWHAAPGPSERHRAEGQALRRGRRRRPRHPRRPPRRTRSLRPHLILSRVFGAVGYLGRDVGARNTRRHQIPDSGWSEGGGELEDEVELGADLGAGHRAMGAYGGQRRIDVDAQEHEDGHGGGAGPADAGGAVHDQHLAVPQPPRQVVEERPVRIERRCTQIVDREPDRARSCVGAWHRCTT